MKKVFLISMLLFGTSNLFAAEFTFRYGHAQGAENARTMSMKWFEKELEKRSKGRIEVKAFYSSTLGNEREMMDMIPMGALQGTRGGTFKDANPKFSIVELPFLVSNWDEALCLVRSDYMKGISRGARKNGYHVPAVGITQGFRAHTNNVRPITKPSDIEGLRMRVPGSEVYIQTAKALGANPISMPFGEAYQAFQTGVIDGQDNPPANIWDYKVMEVQKFMSITNYSTGPDPLMVSLDWYKKLPKNLQTIFDEVASEALAKSDEAFKSSETNLIRKLTRYMKINYVQGNNLNAFRKKTGAVYDYFIKKGTYTQNDIDNALRAAQSCR